MDKTKGALKMETLLLRLKTQFPECNITKEHIVLYKKIMDCNVKLGRPCDFSSFSVDIGTLRIRLETLEEMLIGGLIADEIRAEMHKEGSDVEC